MKSVHFSDLTLTFSLCASFVHHSVMVNVTWPRFDQSVKHLVVENIFLNLEFEAFQDS